MLGFFKHFGIKTVEKTGKGLMDVLVSFDPETATEAEISKLDEYLTTITKKMVEAKVDFEKEQKEYEIISANYNKLVVAAGNLQVMLDQATEENKGKIENSLNTLLDELEAMKPEVVREKAEAEEAKVYFNELQEAVKAAATKFKSARSDLNKAKKQMEVAGVRMERAKEKEERVKVLNGLKTDTNKIGSALSAMQRKADEMNQKAEVATTKQSLLETPEAKNTDDLVAEALRMSAPAPTTVSTSDRLKNLSI